MQLKAPLESVREYDECDEDESKANNDSHGQDRGPSPQRDGKEVVYGMVRRGELAEDGS